MGDNEMRYLSVKHNITKKIVVTSLTRVAFIVGVSRKSIYNWINKGNKKNLCEEVYNNFIVSWDVTIEKCEPRGNPNKIKYKGIYELQR